LVHATHTSVAGGITFRTTGGTGVNFLTGQKALVYCDGTSVFNIAGNVSALDPSNNLSDVGNTSATLVNLGVSAFSGGVSALDNTIQISSGKLQVNTSAIFEVIYPIGSMYSNRTDSTNPGTLIGFGTWASAGVGRVLVGVGTGVDSNTVSAVFTVGTCGGEYEHTLTTAESLPITLGLDVNRRTDIQAGSGRGAIDIKSGGGSTTSAKTCALGGGSAFNLQQPWFSVFMWTRTA